MELTTEIKIRKTSYSRLHEIDFKSLQFGKNFSDHMLICDFHDEHWHEPIIVPFANLSLSPGTIALHYGQTVFEGMKAFRMIDGRVNIFRMEKHYDRFVRSLQRMSMAVVPKEVFIEGLKALVDLDKEWIPREPDCALYLRPFVIATENAFGVKVSSDYRFIIFTAPVPAVYSTPIKVKVETQYIRAAKGGTGFAKCGGNYGGSLYPTQLARQEGYDQLLWTDATHHRFVEESGMMNVMFVIGDTIVTPRSSETVLDGVTKDSLLTLANDLQFKVEERPISLEELENAFRNNSISEAFGVGTAAVIAPIKIINIDNTDFHLPEYSHETLSHKLKQKLERIRSGQEEDLYNWCHVV